MSHDDHESHHVNYLVVFAALCGFTALSVIFDVLSFENHAVTIVLVMAVAVAKALCVMMFFMHLKFEGNWKFILLAPTTILAIGLPLALMPDVGLAYYTPTAPQRGEWGEQMKQYRKLHPHAAEGHDTAPHNEEPHAQETDLHTERENEPPHTEETVPPSE